jgi:hypothetical protein
MDAVPRLVEVGARRAACSIVERKGEARRVDDVSREAEPRALPGVASSMISILVFAGDDEIRQLLSQPESIYEFIEQERTSQRKPVSSRHSASWAVK